MVYIKVRRALIRSPATVRILCNRGVAGRALARRNQFVYGHHGTKKELAEAILATGFEQSERESDWLGFGVYFWEDSPARARLWGEQKFPDHPLCILDAKIALERCLNLAEPGRGRQAQAVLRALHRCRRCQDRRFVEIDRARQSSARLPGDQLRLRAVERG